MVHYVQVGTLALLCTLLVIYIVYATQYPKVAGEFFAAGVIWKYRVGRIPFYNAGKFYFYISFRWARVDPDRVRSLLAISQWEISYISKSVWCHILDCGLIYPGIYFVLCWMFNRVLV